MSGRGKRGLPPLDSKAKRQRTANVKQLTNLDQEDIMSHLREARKSLKDIMDRWDAAKKADEAASKAAERTQQDLFKVETKKLIAKRNVERIVKLADVQYVIEKLNTCESEIENLKSKLRVAEANLQWLRWIAEESIKGLDAKDFGKVREIQAEVEEREEFVDSND
ncbi:hypothetical protein F53441_10795 [Fusarium austroafricanum]|uniref:Uncharacterized protein n=1 Tax=Fusarium austroafricanum TaxID=2364996 RepID=A0A8H4K9X7_9HYPO|nr:hypothetical protein F53441_10795 [Fusarium austroafricanum]